MTFNMQPLNSPKTLALDPAIEEIFSLERTEFCKLLEKTCKRVGRDPDLQYQEMLREAGAQRPNYAEITYGVKTDPDMCRALGIPYNPLQAREELENCIYARILMMEIPSGSDYAKPQAYVFHN